MPATNTGAASGATETALFDTREFTRRTIDGSIELVPIEQVTLAANPRKTIDADGITRLARMIMQHGQLLPAIGRRVSPSEVLLYAGQRRKLAVEKSHELADSEGFEDLEPVAGLVVLLLDKDEDPTPGELRRIQAQENSREDLTMADQQEQFADVWADRAGLPDDERIAAVCDDLGITAKKAHNLRRQLQLPEPVRARVSERPADGELSIGMANRLAEMHAAAPELATAVAERITTRELQDKALSDLSASVQRTIVDDTSVYALRIDVGTLLDANREIARARAHLTEAHRETLLGLFGCEAKELEGNLNELERNAKDRAVMISIDVHIRDRAGNGGYAFVHNRGRDFASAIWVIDPTFTIGLAHEHVQRAPDEKAQSEGRYFSGGGVEDQAVKEARADDEKRRKVEHERTIAGYGRNLALGQDIAASLVDPKSEQLDALRRLVCYLLADRFERVIAYGAGWSDQGRQQPVGDTKRYEPRQPASILAAELDRALSDPEPLHGIAELTARFCAAFLLDPAGIPVTKEMGLQRMHRFLHEALPGGDHPARRALWDFMRPMLSPALVEMHRENFVSENTGGTVDLEGHRADTDLAEIDLGGDEPQAA